VASESLRNSDWLAGFADGESCFRVAWLNRKEYKSYSIQFIIALRADDTATLKELQETFGGTLVRRPGQMNAGYWTNPQCRWRITARHEILRLIAYFDQHHLRTGKLEEYQVWREAAVFYYRYASGTGGRNRDNPHWVCDAMEAYKAELERLKKYESEPSDFDLELNDPQDSLFEESEE